MLNFPTSGTISPVRRPLLLCAFRRKYLKCLIISLLIFGCFIASFTCWIHDPEKYKSGCVRTHSFIPLSLLLMFYVVYLIECWRNSPVLMPLVSRSFVQQHIYLIRHAAPVIWWRVVCYHFVRRSRQIVRYRNGTSNTTTQVYYERTNSHVDEREFDYTNCGVCDVSNDVLNLEKHPLVVINFSKCFSFSNLACENQYLGQRCDFFRMNEEWDNYLEAKEGMKLRNVDWKDHFLVCEDPDHPPIYASYPFYWFCSVFLGSWFLRVYLEHKAAIVNYQVEKLFGDPSTEPSEQTYNTLTRVATMDSTEMEWQIQTNQMVAPSYGEVTMETRCPDAQPTCEGRPSPVDHSNDVNQIPHDPRAPSMHRTRSWIREGRRGIMTSLRRSMSQMFGLNSHFSGEDDANLITRSPRERFPHSNTGRPLSEAPPTYSEAMELHRILGYYDEDCHYSRDYDVTKSDYNIHRTATNENAQHGASCNHRNRVKFIRRKRPSHLRIRSQYTPDTEDASPSTHPRSIYPVRDVITGPAAVPIPIEENPIAEVLGVAEVRGSGTKRKLSRGNQRIESNASGKTHSEIGAIPFPKIRHRNEANRDSVVMVPSCSTDNRMTPSTVLISPNQSYGTLNSAMQPSPSR